VNAVSTVPVAYRALVLESKISPFGLFAFVIVVVVVFSFRNASPLQFDKDRCNNERCGSFSLSRITTTTENNKNYYEHCMNT